MSQNPKATMMLPCNAGGNGTDNGLLGGGTMLVCVVLSVFLLGDLFFFSVSMHYCYREIKYLKTLEGLERHLSG